ncbi:hypothetical protein GCM10011384_19020 [Psychrobacillus lasiicapitis]|nr:hypothetical protein GCM10011384_19020 [Psychrobacillus lasiicapitis]
MNYFSSNSNSLPIFSASGRVIVACPNNAVRIQWKELGQKIHMTGQAVGNRIRRLEDLGIIEQYTITINRIKLGQLVTAFVTVFEKQLIIKSLKISFKKKELFLKYIV